MPRKWEAILVVSWRNRREDNADGNRELGEASARRRRILGMALDKGGEDLGRCAGWRHHFPPYVFHHHFCSRAPKFNRVRALFRRQTVRFVVEKKFARSVYAWRSGQCFIFAFIVSTGGYFDISTILSQTVPDRSKSRKFEPTADYEILSLFTDFDAFLTIRFPCKLKIPLRKRT